MKKVRIEVVRMANYEDLMEKYENPIEHACDMRLGQVFLAKVNSGELKLPGFEGVKVSAEWVLPDRSIVK